MNRASLIAAACVVGLLSTGCAAATRSSKAGETDQLKNQVTSLENQVSELNQKVAELSQTSSAPNRYASRTNITPAQRVMLSPKKIQVALKTAGYYSGPVDGKIGKQTRDAVKEFQKANGLNPDGVVGSKTAAALNNAIGKNEADHK